MSHNLSKLVFCELDISYDHNLFAHEIDSVLLPDSTQINATGRAGVKEFLEINRQWNMVPESDYLEENSNKAWYVNSLIYYDADDKDVRKGSELGSVLVRNRTLTDSNLNSKWCWKEKYENLSLTKFIKSLPLTDIIHARLLYLPPGYMSVIHRDDRHSNEQFKLSKNLLSSTGHLSITLNISTGGQPLFFATDSSPVNKIFKPSTFIFNDYFMHGVPKVTSPRRQFRISGKPTKELFEKIIKSTVLEEC